MRNNHSETNEKFISSYMIRMVMCVDKIFDRLIRDRLDCLYDAGRQISILRIDYKHCVGSDQKGDIATTPIKCVNRFGQLLQTKRVLRLLLVVLRLCLRDSGYCKNQKDDQRKN